MTKLFDTALPPIWYLCFWALGLVALYLAIRFGIAHGLRDAQQFTSVPRETCDNSHGEVRG